MRLADRLRRDWRFLSGLLRTLGRVRSIAATSTNLICDDLESAVDRWKDRPAIAFEGRTITYGELDAMANRYAHWAQDQGIHRGDTVALVMPNRLEYLAIWYGLTKVGVATALINNQLAGKTLAHCLNISGARHCLVDGDTWPAFEAARPLLTHDMQEWTLSEAHSGQRNLAQSMKGASALRPDRAGREGMTAADTALYIYTSGTTGLPKAARVTHMRAQLYMRGFAGATGAREDDRIHVSLPLYHATGGLCAMGAALLNGGSVALKQRFSATHFWQEIADDDCTQFVYIGELCRYLANQPRQDVETKHRLRLAFGNGLRPDVWAALEDRFGVPRVLEFYGSTEGNVSMFNFDGARGAIGRAPKWLRTMFNIRLVRFDVEKEAPVRAPNGFCVEARPGEVGECLGQIHDDARTAYTGYADKAASEKKVLHDVLARGDRWFRTGDLMRQDADGYFYFVDRVGDTFRWKGENVSTGEVSERLLAAPGVLEANVYGVKVGDLDGRAGMAGLVTDAKFDLKAFAAHVERELPAYAQPVFLRLLPAIETTGTFKYRKLDLVADGFDPSKVRDRLYVKAGDTYRPIDAKTFDAVMSGELRI
ncbi:MAG TPA: long-chain-acyl-CoA synthetase [Caulobacteraceae bacterium]|nr:long-chain-acyl-CoA synthetase [Caulobacteraceae bacterium]